MKKLALLGVAALLGAVAFTAPAAALDPNQCAALPNGFLRDGTTSCAYILKVNSDGSINVSTSGGGASDSTDISGTVTLGGTYQQVAAASTARRNCTIQNPTTATEVLNVKLGTMAQPYTLSAGMSFSSGVASDAITVTAATTSHAFAGTCQ